MLLHTGMSIVVFNAVKQKRISLLFLAIVLHMIFDTAPALYQKGIINLYATEGIIAVLTLVFFVVIYRTLYVKDDQDYKPRES